MKHVKFQGKIPVMTLDFVKPPKNATSQLQWSGLAFRETKQDRLCTFSTTFNA